MAEEAERGNRHFSHFSPETNLFEELERAFRDYGESGTGTTRHYVHDDDEAKLYGAEPGTFTEWGPLPESSDLLFYEGLHGAVVTDKVNIAQHADLKIGVVPVINLEWIQKLHRDRSDRGYTAEAVTDTILRRMPDYVNYICPQFAETDINFQRVPTVDTSNPFIARWIPTPDKSMVVIRLKNPRGIDFPYLLSMIPQQLHVARQFDRDPRLEARPGDAAHSHPADPATDGTQEAHGMNAPALLPYRQPPRCCACGNGECDPLSGDRRGREGEVRPSGHADGHGRRRHRAVLALSQIRSRRSGVAGSRSLRAVGRSRLDAAVCAAASDGLRGRDAWTNSRRSGNGDRRRPAIPNMATRRASRRPPGRWGRASRPPSAWRWPSG